VSPLPPLPSLLVADSLSSRMNGPTAVKELRALGCHVPIIGLTGNVLPEDVELFISHGADAVLGKPLTINRLADCLAALPISRSPPTCSSSSGDPLACASQMAAEV
jgi:CheY-like chemotaxis protein